MTPDPECIDSAFLLAGSPYRLAVHSEPDRRGDLRRLLVSAGFPCEKRPEGTIGNWSSGLACLTTTGAIDALLKVWPGESSRPKVLRPLRR
jgi:hypothetical protein